MPSKYPAFTRPTTGSLVKGDRILVRTVGQDWLPTRSRLGDTDRPAPLPPGIHEVTKVAGPDRRYYRVSVVDTETALTYEIDAPGQQRWNRVTP